MHQHKAAGRRSKRSARVAALSALVLGATLMCSLPGVATASAAQRGRLCVGGSSSGEASRLNRDLGDALASRHSTVSVAFLDLTSGVSCDVAGNRHFDSASVVKTAILATLLWQTQHTHGSMNANERELATAMITQSDNDAATALWHRIGGATGLRRFLAAAGMDQTVPGTGGYWGLTQITARDEIKLLRLLATGNRVLTAKSRAYELGLMTRVESDQRWGAPTGARRGETVAVKNGWLPRASGGWRINTTGVGLGRRSYLVVILSDENPSMQYGVATVNSVARAINHDAY